MINFREPLSRNFRKLVDNWTEAQLLGKKSAAFEMSSLSSGSRTEELLHPTVGEPYSGTVCLHG